MKIAWLGKRLPTCGNGIYCQEITTALCKRGHQVTFIHFASELEEPNKVPKSPDLETIALPYLYNSLFYPIPSFQTSQVLINALQSSHFDLLHASLVLSPFDYWLPAICAAVNLPLVATFHQPFDVQYRTRASTSQQLIYKLYSPALLPLYDRVIIFSELQKKILNQLGTPNSRIAVIPNGVDAEKYSPGPSRIKQELQADYLFLYQGRLVAEKNVEALLQAWQRSLMPEGYKLAIVGTGPLAAQLQTTYSDRNIVWLGYIGDEQRRIEILRGTDVFILPSLVEGLSLSLLEAMSCGVACVATDVGADGEVLAVGAGVVIDVRDVTTQLCALFAHWVKHPEFIKTLGERARQRILERYTLTQNLNQLELLYDQTVSQFRRNAFYY